MRSSEKLCLKWNDSQENLNSALGDLRNDQDFADVTLACEDGTHIETHKVILASSSPFFREMLKRNKHPHPLIYMSGVKAEELLAMVDFLYYGEANVCQESLDVFLSLAEELKLKGLSAGSSSESSTVDLRDKATSELKFEKRKHQELKTNLNKAKPMSAINFNVKTESTSVALVSVEADQLDEQIKSMMTLTENEITVEKRQQKAYACNVCGKVGHSPNIKTHIESNHIESNIAHSCDTCGKKSRSRDGLRQHKAKDHFKQTRLQDERQFESPQKQRT